MIPFVSLALLSRLSITLNSLLIKLITDHLVLPPASKPPLQLVWPAVLWVMTVAVYNLCWCGMGYINYQLPPLLKSSVMSETAGRVHRYSLFMGRILYYLSQWYQEQTVTMGDFSLIISLCL